MSARELVVAELRRELQQRSRVYAKWIQAGKMHRHQAVKRYTRLRDAVRFFERLTDAEYTQVMGRTTAYQTQSLTLFQTDADDAESSRDTAG